MKKLFLILCILAGPAYATDVNPMDINTQCITASATSSSGSTIIGLSTAPYANRIMVKNAGTAVINIAVGNTGVVAYSSSMALVPGEVGTFSKNSQYNDAAVYAASGTNAVYICPGEGQ